MVALPIARHIFSVSSRFSWKSGVVSCSWPIRHFAGLRCPRRPSRGETFSTQHCRILNAAKFSQNVVRFDCPHFDGPSPSVLRGSGCGGGGGMVESVNPYWTLAENKEGRHESSWKWKLQCIDLNPAVRLRYRLEILLLICGWLAPEQIKNSLGVSAPQVEFCQ